MDKTILKLKINTSKSPMNQLVLAIQIANIPQIGNAWSRWEGAKRSGNTGSNIFLSKEQASRIWMRKCEGN